MFQASGSMQHASDLPNTQARPSTARLRQAGSHRQLQVTVADDESGNKPCEERTLRAPANSPPELRELPASPPQQQDASASPPKKVRETVSQRMKRVLAERQLATNPFPPPAPSTSPGSSSPSEAPAAAAGGREVASLEDMCVQQVAKNAINNKLSASNLTDVYCPDYLREKMFELVRRHNQLLLGGKTLHALVCGAQFSSLDLRNCTNVRDYDLQMLAPSLPLLTSLDISHCP
eukprot:CAMPEP_0172074880 /NCGR_PEP_ID=MMETSP1043-20130122/15651_1 /TAXON_ID=464988 /ORGANISM="Hemiselmis andersenii, Strain CCMP441" /LENGTH=233 /DNA_ID=CAMNT_0012735577 /DNA_START=142 /DNA_END=840 /DNA_ORIENTATION=-